MAMTLDDIKKMSPQKKALIVCILYCVLGYFYWFLFLQSALEKRGTLQTKLSELQQQVTEKERIAAEKDKYVREVGVLKETFRMALTKLPDRKEIPGLLSAVERAGKSAGVEFILFEPIASEKKPSEQKPPLKPSEPEQFYEEIPIRITVNGSFHQTALFFGKVARLPRIVNIEDVSMVKEKDVKGSGHLLSTSCVAKTYMFVEKSDGKNSEADEKNK
ncbi:MAG: type 4a pilus biogenesis protein PilO [Syntrophales bacterium]|nr:type 4a pilus biogenesis protein PilO [Syntrophales bacterium]